MNDILVQRPAIVRDGTPELFLLFHGVGASAKDLHGVGQSLALRHPEAWIVCVQAPDASDLGQGYQWFSVRGVSPENRSIRVAAAMPGFLQAVASWQMRSGSDASRTTLIGFSQGAIMSLDAGRRDPPVASRVVSIAGRFVTLPESMPEGVQIHLFHGDADGVVPVNGSVDAHSTLQALGTPSTLDLFSGLGHGIDGRLLTRLLERLDIQPVQGGA